MQVSPPYPNGGGQQWLQHTLQDSACMFIVLQKGAWSTGTFLIKIFTGQSRNILLQSKEHKTPRFSQ